MHLMKVFMAGVSITGVVLFMVVVGYMLGRGAGYISGYEQGT